MAMSCMICERGFIKMKKRIWRSKTVQAVFLAAAAAALCGCGNKEGGKESADRIPEGGKYGSIWENTVLGPNGEKTVAIKVADFLAEDNPVNRSLNERLKPMLEEKTEGRYTLEVYADGDLGGETDFLKGIKRGTIEMGISGVELSEEFPMLKAVDFPFVFEDIDSSFYALSDTEVMEALNESLRPSGIICKGFVLTGIRSISNNVRPIRTPEDCKGLTLRTPNVTQFIDYAQRLGFKTINASVPEIFTVLQQNQADGQENPPTTFLTSGWYKVQKYLSLTKHQITYNWLAVNREFYDSMTEKDREAFDECCRIYTESLKEAYKKREASDLETLKELGVEIIEVDREPFRAVGNEMIEDYKKRYPDFQRMLEMLRQKGAK